MPTDRLTKRSVDLLKPASIDVILWDDSLAGFGVKITPSGHKSYVVQYRPGVGGRRSASKRIVLGTHGALTPDEARKLAKRELGRVAQGQDPADERAKKKGEKKVRELGTEYLEEVKARRKPGTYAEYKRLWDKHVVPTVGSKSVAEVDLSHIRKLHRDLSETPYVANRLMAMLGAFFAFAEREHVKLKNGNPVRGIELYHEQPRERYLTAAEFAKLGEALVKAETEGLPPVEKHKSRRGKPENQKHRPKSADIPIPANPLAVAAIRLLALTGCREGEILSLRWDAVDLERGYLRLADSKTGKSIRPLGASAAAILESLPRVEKNPYVLPGAREGQPLKEIGRTWLAVRQEAKLDDVRLHDLRHSFASVPATSGESMLVLRSLLGHKRVSTTERYAHLGDDPVKRAANTASASIASWLGVATVESPGASND